MVKKSSEIKKKKKKKKKIKKKSNYLQGEMILDLFHQKSKT